MSKTSETKTLKVFSPTQAVVGTFFGGILAGIYYLASNFHILNDSKSKLITIIVGSLWFLLTLALSISFPELPGILFYLPPLLAVGYICVKYQFTKEEISNEEDLDFESNWLVFFISLTGFGLSIYILFKVFIVLGVS